jgi:Mrp family chromosome partitioning ATPase
VGKTARAILSRTKKQLEESGVKIKGVVLNNISVQMQMQYGYYHYKYFGKYYSSPEDESKDKNQSLPPPIGPLI